ncbi:hypothetical protein JQ607_26980 [Bradyrhizobium liaoningense]|uniref:hypothetical protein n=1 Tax=Bradyrhizobium liaoningense TaxID=43992 RepID=UPI001BAB3138|nr:hypothetical protein [Bradyrhizobium liaoningense]MBR0843855.1 hypothetical protein [Bradyrhizobium liaoningense]
MNSQVSNDILERVILGSLIGFHIIACCISLACLSRDYYVYHIYYDPVLLKGAALAIAAFALLSYVFLRAPFSFGYFVGFYFYTMVVGYLWLNSFSRFEYNHWLSGASAVASMVGFLAPALFVSSPIRQRFRIEESTFDRMLTFILVVGVATILFSATYSFRLVSLAQMYEFREKITIPNPLYYWIGITSNSLLPFIFACFVVRKSYWRAGFTLALLLLFYPITLNKIALFTPAWLLTLAVLTRLFDCRVTVVISLLLPLIAGLVLYQILGTDARRYLELVNLRMIATPSNAMDIYNDFFFHHPYTYFCQIRLLKALVACPYQDQLGVVMSSAYGLGNFNASLFSTEGIASVGPLLAPIPVLICGLVVAFANRLSAGLPSRLVLISSSVLPQILLNVPLTTTLLSHGAAFLFLLWYVAPRSMFPEQAPLVRVAFHGLSRST